MEIMQRHILPGFYNQFKAVPSNAFQQNGTLGVVAVGLVMDWGKDDEPTELFSEDLITGLSLRKVGYTINDTNEILPYMLSLISAYKGYFVKMNKGGNKASATSGDIKAEALYTGIFGNRLSFSIAANTPTTGKYTVTIYIDSVRKESFVVSDAEELFEIGSDFIKFSSEETTPAIVTVAETTLTGGTNGDVIETTTSGTKATKTIGSLVFTAKNEGVNGNKIGITIAENATDSSKYDLKVNVDSVEMESFEALADVAAFAAVTSTLVDITNPSGTSIVEATNSLLTGGTDASESSYQAYKDELKYKQFNVCSIMIANAASSNAVIEFVNNQIQIKRKLVQGVVYNKPLLNNYNIITVDQGLECDDFNVTIELNIALITSLRAGCPLNESLTDFNLTELVGAKKIINPINDDDDTDLENAKAQGKFVYRYISDGSVRVLQDINTLVNFTVDEPKGYRKNRHIAILDYLINEENRIAHSGPIGKYSNTAEKRNLIAAKFIGIYNELFQMGAIKEYDPVTDMIVTMGDETDLVNVNQTVKPTDSIEIINSITNVDFNVES